MNPNKVSKNASNNQQWVRWGVVVGAGILIIALIYTIVHGKEGASIAQVPTRTPTLTAKVSPTPTATPAPTATPEPLATPIAPGPGFSSYIPQDNSFRINRPSDWRHYDLFGDQQGVLAFEVLFNPVGGGPIFMASHLNLPLDAQAETLAVQGEIDGLTGQNETLPTSQTVKAGGYTWQMITTTFVRNGQPLTLKAYAQDRNSVMYVLMLVDATYNLQADDTAFFQPMIDSFTFLK